MSWVAVAIGASAVVGAGAGMISSSKAASATENAAEQASQATKETSERSIAAQMEMFYQNREDLAPWRAAGEYGLSKLLGTPDVAGGSAGPTAGTAQNYLKPSGEGTLPPGGTSSYASPNAIRQPQKEMYSVPGLGTVDRATLLNMNYQPDEGNWGVPGGMGDTISPTGGSPSIPAATTENQQNYLRYTGEGGLLGEGAPTFPGPDLTTAPNYAGPDLTKAPNWGGPDLTQTPKYEGFDPNRLTQFAGPEETIYSKQLSDMVGKGTGLDQFTTSPGYQFRLGEGLNAIETSASARGSQLSGDTLKALNDYAQSSASDEYEKWLSQWFQKTQFLSEQDATELAKYYAKAGFLQNQDQATKSAEYEKAAWLANQYQTDLGNQYNKQNFLRGQWDQNLGDEYSKAQWLSSQFQTDLGNQYQKENYLRGQYFENLEPYFRVAGIGGDATKTTAQMGQTTAANVGNTITGAGSDIAGNYLKAGEAKAGGYINAANTVSGAASSGAENYLLADYLKRNQTNLNMYESPY